MTTIDEQAAPIAIPIRPDETKVERHERLRLLVRSPTFLIGCVLAGIWVICAIFGYLIAPHDPGGARHPQQVRAALRRSTSSERTSSARTFSRG